MNRYAVAYDDVILSALATTPEAFEREARLLLAAKLFEQSRLTSGQASRLAGLDRVAFLYALKQVGVSAINLADGDLDDDFAHA
jgi:predicted HTH domain antitoxin